MDHVLEDVQSSMGSCCGVSVLFTLEISTKSFLLPCSVGGRDSPWGHNIGSFALSGAIVAKGNLR